MKARRTLFKIKCILGLILTVIGICLIFGKNHQNKSVLYSVQTCKKLVALTFDDGPHPIYTSQLLDILNHYQVKATFFMIGSLVKRYPFIVKQVIANGHSIGNHTYTHPLNMAVCSKSQIVKELTDCESIIRRLTGRRVFIFRPPRGLFNEKVIRIAQKNKYRTVLWSVCGDKRRLNNPKLMAERVIRNIHPGDIILLHDGTADSRWKDVEATQFIIEALLKKGYRFVTIPQLLKESPP
jgi:peptidoglycan/xylan/chitin deacetylase (PgdA/CDA1 family)